MSASPCNARSCSTSASSAAFAGGDAEGRRLDHNERAQRGRGSRGCEQANDTAVGEADEVVAVAERRRELVRLVLEARRVDRGAGR